MADTEAVPLKQRRRNRKKTAIIINVGPDQEFAVNEKADKDFPVEAAADDRE